MQSTGREQEQFEARLTYIDLVQRITTLEQEIQNFKKFFTVGTSVVNNLNDDKWELKNPLNVNIEQRGPNEFVACLYDIDLYGYGDSVPEALEDLKNIITSQFEFLDNQVGKVQFGSLPEKQFEFLKKILREK